MTLERNRTCYFEIVDRSREGHISVSGIAVENQAPIQIGRGRLEIEEWLARTRNLLSARVMVNGVWEHHFGQGLVKTPDNFGVTGSRPPHPELLDYLPSRFVESGWSVK